MMSAKRREELEVAYLGPVGTYSLLVAEKRYGKKCKFTPLPTVLDVCSYVSGKDNRRGIIPIENSSGGAIYETVDILLANKPRIHILEELTLNVRLALLGRKGEKIKTLYSHFAPLEHCVPWVRRHLPRAERKVVTSTAAAAELAAERRYSAALGNRKLGRIYGLDILVYPVEVETQNMTIFLNIAGKKREIANPKKTTLVVRLPNMPGSLCSFLDIFRGENVNLSRILSQPIRGCPREYAFLVDIDGAKDSPAVQRALKAARKTCVELRSAGSYPIGPSYQS
jgi:prephenate dehydratase